MKKKKYAFLRITKSLVCTLAFSILAGCEREYLYTEKQKPEVVISAAEARFHARLIHLYGDTVYVLANDLVLDSGRTLRIEPGTLVKVNNGISITIGEGSAIEAVGTAENPIVLTSSAYTGGSNRVNFWRGIRLYGNALGNLASSGDLRYVRIEFAGDPNELLPSILIKDVAKGTRIEHIQVSYSNEVSSFELSGGDVDGSNLVSYASSRNDFYIHDGYKGMLQGILAYRHPYFPAFDDADFAGILIDGAETYPNMSNVSVIGPDLQAGTSFRYLEPFERRVSLLTSGGSRFRIRNSVLMGFPRGGWYLSDQATGSQYLSGESELMHSVVHCNDLRRTFYLPDDAYPPFTSDDFRSYVLQPQFNNRVVEQFSAFMLAKPFDYDGNPDPAPSASSPLLSGAVFDGAFADPFFHKVSYIGALGTDTEDWLQGWTNFTPLQSNYNN